MSAGNCPVCDEPKEKRWHLVCPYCWVKVPDADQAEIYDLYKHRRGSLEHRLKCRHVVRTLCIARRDAAQAENPARTP